MARYAISLECHLEGVFESRTLELMATLDFVENNLYNKEFMIKFLEERLKSKVFSYGIKNVRCMDIHFAEKKLTAMESYVLALNERIQSLESKLEELTLGSEKGKEKIEDVQDVENVSSESEKVEDVQDIENVQLD